MDIHLKSMSLNDPIPYEPTRKFTEFVQVEVEEEEEELPSKVKYSVILQEEEYESEEEDFFRDK